MKQGKQVCVVCMTNIGMLVISQDWVDKQYKDNKLNLVIEAELEWVWAYCDLTQNEGIELFSYEMGLEPTDVTCVSWLVVSIDNGQYTCANDGREVRVIPIDGPNQYGMHPDQETAWKLFIEKLKKEQAYHRYMFNLRENCLDHIKDRPFWKGGHFHMMKEPTYRKVIEKFSEKLKEHIHGVLS